MARFSSLFSSPARADEVLAPAGADVALGRVTRRLTEEQVESSSVALAEMMFGRGLRSLPEGWFRAPALGVMTDELVAACPVPRPVQVAPGWAYAVVERVGAPYFVVETRALETGAWAGTLEPGGEHMVDELLSLVALARRERLTPVLVVNGSRVSPQPGSLKVRSALDRLMAAIPARVDGLVGLDERRSVFLSPFVQALAGYSQACSSQVVV